MRCSLTTPQAFQRYFHHDFSSHALWEAHFRIWCKSLFTLFCVSRLPWPHKVLKVPFSFCCKIAMKRCFSLVGGSLVLCGSLLGLFFIKAYFRASFFAFFSFCYTSHAKRTIFKMRSGTFLAHFAIMRFTADV